MEPGSVYDLKTGDVLEAEFSEQSIGQDDNSYLQAVQVLCGRVDHNLKLVYGWLMTLRGTDTQKFNAIREQYTGAWNAYQVVRDQAVTLPANSPTQSQLQEAIQQLENMVSFTNTLSDRVLQAQQAAADSGTNQERSFGNMSGSTAMVTTNQQPQEIVMQEAGPVRSWWEGLNPSTKTIIKAAAIGAAVFAGKKLFDFLMKKYAMNAIKSKEDDDEQLDAIERADARWPEGKLQEYEIPAAEDLEEEDEPASTEEE